MRQQLGYKPPNSVTKFPTISIRKGLPYSNCHLHGLVEVLAHLALKRRAKQGHVSE